MLSWQYFLNSNAHYLSKYIFELTNICLAARDKKFIFYLTLFFKCIIPCTEKSLTRNHREVVGSLFKNRRHFKRIARGNVSR